MSQDITAKELKDRINAGEQLLILDVREPSEFQESNINGKLIPLGTLPNRIGEIEDWKGKEVIVHCRSGKRSANAQSFLEMQGFENVRNLEGGILAYNAL
ncbi:MAG TPA: rhodanese-like domain-containing protein [Cytophagales bacterium]|nr:rhodanese-like domain-containing protein [Cytophagales bacterium]